MIDDGDVAALVSSITTERASSCYVANSGQRMEPTIPCWSSRRTPGASASA